jgi:CzcA family heavy metal efflux pump
MIRGAIATSVRRPRVMVFAWLCLVIAAAVYAAGSRLEMFPRLQPAAATIQTEAPGLVAEQVERLVTRPLESALQGEAGVAAVRSQSIQGLSVITVDFAPGSDPAEVQERLAGRLAEGARQLPSGVDPPRLDPLVSPAGDILKVGFTSARLNPMQLRNEVQWVVRPQLLAVPGVARVSVYGGQTLRIEVRARPGDLSDSDLGLLDVVRAVQRSTSIAGAGFIDTPAQRVLIEPRGQALTTDEVGAGQIQSAGNAPTRIGDVSDVVEAPAPQVGDALVMGRAGVVLAVRAQYGSDAVAEAKAVQRALDQLRPALEAQGVQVTADIDQPAAVIASAVRSVLIDLAIGAGLALVLMLLALRDARAALISFLGVPIALVLAAAALRALGLSLNTMTLGGLVLGLGLVIDDGLIDVENILSRLRDAEVRHASHAEAVLRASLEVRGPVLIGTLVIALALAPLLPLPGTVGALLRPLATAAILALVASVLIALLLTPALALMLLPHVGPEPHPPIVRRLKDAHGRWIERCCSRPAPVLLPALAAVLVAVVALAVVARTGPPQLHGGRVVVDLTAPGSISPDAMRDVGERISRDILAVPGVQTVSEEIGRDPTATRAWGLGRARFDVGLGASPTIADQDRAASRIRKAVAAYPGFRAEVSTAYGASANAPPPQGRFVVAVVGEDSGALAEVAGKVADVLRTIPQAGEVHAPDPQTAPAIRVDLNFDSLAIYGLSAADVMETVQVAFEGERAAQVYQAGRTVDLAVTAGSDLPRDPDAVGDLLLRSTSGFSTPLKKVAKVYLTEAPSSIVHEGGLAQALVTADPPARDAKAFAARAQSAISKQVALPDGVYVTYPRPEDASAGARHALLMGALLAVAAILVVLLLAFRSSRSALLILSAGPPALVGAAIVILLGGGALGFGEAAGLIALFGLSARNAMLLLARIEELVLRRGREWSMATLTQAAGDRLIPILAAALSIALGLLPLILFDRQPGAEILRPMAAVILAGLVTGSAFSVLVLPILAHRFWRPHTEAQ